jgi:hypothetical protein
MASRLPRLLRRPDRVIGQRYLHRWHILPRNPWLNVYLHRFVGSDSAIHDHPWWSVSFLLRGELWERWRTPAHDRVLLRLRRVPWLRPVLRSPTYAHALTLTRGPAWTIFVTGPVVREWGFWTEKGWRPWRECAPADALRPGGE